MQWYADVHSVPESHNIDWGNWDYKGGLGIVTRDAKPDEGFIKVLIGEARDASKKRA